MYESQPQQKGTLRNQITNIFGNSKDSTQTNSARALEQNRVNTKPVLKIKPMTSELKSEDNDDEISPFSAEIKDKSGVKKFKRKGTGTFTLKNIFSDDANIDRSSNNVEGENDKAMIQIRELLNEKQ